MSGSYWALQMPLSVGSDYPSLLGPQLLTQKGVNDDSLGATSAVAASGCRSIKLVSLQVRAWFCTVAVRSVC